MLSKKNKDGKSREKDHSTECHYRIVSPAFQYKMSHQRVGKCIIINNKNFDEKTGKLSWISAFRKTAVDGGMKSLYKCWYVCHSILMNVSLMNSHFKLSKHTSSFNDQHRTHNFLRIFVKNMPISKKRCLQRVIWNDVKEEPRSFNGYFFKE